MKKIFYISSLTALIIVLASFSYKIMKVEIIENPVLLSEQKSYVAGTDIELKFSLTTELKPQLFIHHSYGITLLESFENGDIYTFKIPVSFTKKTGVLNYSLIAGGNLILKNNLEIVPNESSTTHTESYFGPRSIQAGIIDYSMLTVVPTDGFDNPQPNGTKVNVHQQYLSSITSKEETVENFFIWQNIYTRRKAGTILVSSTCKENNSKELNTIIYPGNATDFTINYTRNHNFADGNQITSFRTSVIKDFYDNPVSDGTYVEFHITSSNGFVLKTNGNTKNGVAIAKMLHPPNNETWTVKAFITGLAESNTITVNYIPVTEDLIVTLSKDNRTINVGPLYSFMNQLIPDGATVYLNIYNKDKLIETKTNTSKDGYTSFYLSSEFYYEDNYTLTIESLGVIKKFENLNYANISQ